MVLRRRAEHRRSADVDILDQGPEIVRPGKLFLERVEIDRQKVDSLDALVRHGLTVLFIVATRENPAMDRRMKRLDPAVHDFRKTCHLRDVGHGKPGIAKRARRAAGRQNLISVRGKTPGEFDQSRLVGNGK